LQIPRRQQANRASKRLAAKSYFYRDRGTCSICGAEKKVITAL
jgi:ribosomal protein S14